MISNIINTDNISTMKYEQKAHEALDGLLKKSLKHINIKPLKDLERKIKLLLDENEKLKKENENLKKTKKPFVQLPGDIEILKKEILRLRKREQENVETINALTSNNSEIHDKVTALEYKNKELESKLHQLTVSNNYTQNELQSAIQKNYELSKIANELHDKTFQTKQYDTIFHEHLLTAKELIETQEIKEMNDLLRFMNNVFY